MEPDRALQLTQDCTGSGECSAGVTHPDSWEALIHRMWPEAGEEEGGGYLKAGGRASLSPPIHLQEGNPAPF